MSSRGETTLQLVTPEQQADAEEAARAAARKAAELCTELAEWLAHSPNNPGYLESETYARYKEWLEIHGPVVEAELSSGIQSLSFDPEHSDVQAILDLHAGRQKDPSDPDPQYLTAYNVAYSGIAGVVERFREADTSSDMDSLNAQARQALGATMLHAYYLQRLAERNEDLSEVAGERPFHRMFRQNSTAIVQRITLLESAHQQSGSGQQTFDTTLPIAA